MDLDLRGSNLCQLHEKNREIFAEMYLSRNEINKVSFSIVRNGFKLISSYKPSMSNWQYEFFDLRIDPKEVYNLVNVDKYQHEMIPLVSNLNTIIHEYLQQMSHPIPPSLQVRRPFCAVRIQGNRYV